MTTRRWLLAHADAELPAVFMVDGGGKTVKWDGDESDVYGGRQLTRAWVAWVAKQPKGSVFDRPELTVTVQPDGSLLLKKKLITPVSPSYRAEVFFPFAPAKRLED